MLWQGGVIVEVVDHKGSIGLGVYRREEREETVYTEQKGITRHKVAI